ncbi:MAG: hypothetical protein JRG97_15115, partial [Deltaproteobacteria bacterium]|nr:hypothetical protein [Deltaproteobacteria bacterium]
MNSPFTLTGGDLIFKVDTAGGEKEALKSPLIKDFKETPAPNIKPSRKLPPVLDDLKARYRRVSGSAN